MLGTLLERFVCNLSVAESSRITSRSVRRTTRSVSLIRFVIRRRNSKSSDSKLVIRSVCIILRLSASNFSWPATCYIPPMSYTHPAQAIIPFGQNKVSTESSKIKRIFIVGQSGHGKSTSAFKDPPGSCVYVDGENNAPPEFSTRSDILYLPFHDLAWVKKNFSAAPTVTHALMAFLDFEGPARKLPPETVLLIDSLSWIADELNNRLNVSKPKSSTTGNDDGYWYWKEWV